MSLAPVRQILTRAGGVAGWIEVLGEPTAVPELFVIPVRNRDGRYRGSFSLTHAPSGFAVASDLDPCWFDNQRATLGELRELADNWPRCIWTGPGPTRHRPHRLPDHRPRRRAGLAATGRRERTTDRDRPDQ